MDCSVVFASLCQWVAHVTHASLGLHESITQTASRSVQPFCTAHGRVSSEMLGRVLPLKIAPFHGELNPHLTRGSLVHPTQHPKTASQLDQPFTHSSRQTVPILYNGSPSPKMPFPMGDLDPHLIHGSLGPPEPSIITAS